MTDKIKLHTDSKPEFDPYDMIKVMNRLSEILQIENSFLENMQIIQVSEYYEEKIKLIIILEGYKKILTENPSFINDLSAETLAKVKKEEKLFAVLAAKNGEQLLRAKKVHSIVMDAVRDVVTKKVTQEAGYNNAGNFYPGLKGEMSPPPVSINKTI